MTGVIVTTVREKPEGQKSYAATFGHGDTTTRANRTFSPLSL